MYQVSNNHELSMIIECFLCKSQMHWGKNLVSMVLFSNNQLLLENWPLLILKDSESRGRNNWLYKKFTEYILRGKELNLNF